MLLLLLPLPLRRLRQLARGLAREQGGSQGEGERVGRQKRSASGSAVRAMTDGRELFYPFFQPLQSREHRISLEGESVRSGGSATDSELETRGERVLRGRACGHYAKWS